jgi:hypothetical protein
MQKKRPDVISPAMASYEGVIRTPPDYWDKLKEMDPHDVCERSLAGIHSSGGFLLRFFQKDIRIDLENRCIMELKQDRWERMDTPLLDLLTLVYLLNVTSHPLADEMISAQELKDASFFRGPHELKTGPLLERYGNDFPAFKRAAENLGGEPLDMADMAYRLSPFPRIPLYYLMWEGDEEFAPHLSILFDRSIESHLSADAIWGLVNFTSDLLLMSA